MLKKYSHLTFNIVTFQQCSFNNLYCIGLLLITQMSRIYHYMTKKSPSYWLILRLENRLIDWLWVTIQFVILIFAFFSLIGQNPISIMQSQSLIRKSDMGLIFLSMHNFSFFHQCIAYFRIRKRAKTSL